MLQTSLLLIKGINKTETPIFYLQCVLCFQRQPFIISFHFTAFGVSAVWQPSRTSQEIVGFFFVVVFFFCFFVVVFFFFFFFCLFFCYYYYYYYYYYFCSKERLWMLVRTASIGYPSRRFLRAPSIYVYAEIKKKMYIHVNPCFLYIRVFID